MKESSSLSYGIVPWIRVNDDWHMLLQISLSSTNKDIKIDPMRGHPNAGELGEECACRETYEESCGTLSMSAGDLAHAVKVADVFHAVIEMDLEDLESVTKTFDSNISVIRAAYPDCDYIKLATSSSSQYDIPTLCDSAFSPNDLKCISSMTECLGLVFVSVSEIVDGRFEGIRLASQVLNFLYKINLSDLEAMKAIPMRKRVDGEQFRHVVGGDSTTESLSKLYDKLTTYISDHDHTPSCHTSSRSSKWRISYNLARDNYSNTVQRLRHIDMKRNYEYDGDYIVLSRTEYDDHVVNHVPIEPGSISILCGPLQRDRRRYLIMLREIPAHVIIVPRKSMQQSHMYCK